MEAHPWGPAMAWPTCNLRPGCSKQTAKIWHAWELQTCLNQPGGVQPGKPVGRSSATHSAIISAVLIQSNDA